MYYIVYRRIYDELLLFHHLYQISRLSHGCALVIIYQRNGSEPYFSMVSRMDRQHYPCRFDILLPLASSTKPLEMIFSKATPSNTMVAIACKSKEPTTCLVYTFCNKLSWEFLIEILFVLKRIMLLCIRHCS